MHARGEAPALIGERIARVRGGPANLRSQATIGKTTCAFEGPAVSASSKLTPMRYTYVICKTAGDVVTRDELFKKSGYVD